MNVGIKKIIFFALLLLMGLSLLFGAGCSQSNNANQSPTSSSDVLPVDSDTMNSDVEESSVEAISISYNIGNSSTTEFNDNDSASGSLSDENSSSASGDASSNDGFGLEIR